MNENAASSRVKQKGFIPESFERWFSSVPAFFRQISLSYSTQIFHQEKQRNQIGHLATFGPTLHD